MSKPITPLRGPTPTLFSCAGRPLRRHRAATASMPFNALPPKRIPADPVRAGARRSSTAPHRGCVSGPAAASAEPSCGAESVSVWEPAVCGSVSAGWGGSGAGSAARSEWGSAPGSGWWARSCPWAVATTAPRSARARPPGSATRARAAGRARPESAQGRWCRRLRLPAGRAGPRRGHPESVTRTAPVTRWGRWPDRAGRRRGPSSRRRRATHPLRRRTPAGRASSGCPRSAHRGAEPLLPSPKSIPGSTRSAVQVGVRGIVR